MIFERLVLGMLQTNCYILGDEQTNEVALFDPACRADIITDTIKEKGYKVKYIIVTHAHIDHIIALDAVKSLTGALVVVHKNDAEALNNPDLNLAKNFSFGSPASKPDILANDGDVFNVGKHELKIIATPGHNKGSMCILCDDILIAGDTLFLESIGRTDFYGGSYSDIISSIKNKLMVLDDNIKVYSGHGEPTTIGHEKKFNPYIN